MQLKTKPKGCINRVGVVKAPDKRRLKYRAIWRENGKQRTKGFATVEEAIAFRNSIEKKLINDYKNYLDREVDNKNIEEVKIDEVKKCGSCKYHYIEEISFNSPQSCCKKRKATTEKWLKCDDFEYDDNYIKLLIQRIEYLERYNNICEDTILKVDRDKTLYGHRINTANEYIESRKDNMIPEHYNDLKYILNECDLESTW